MKSRRTPPERTIRAEQKKNPADLTISTFHAFALSALQDKVPGSVLPFSAGIISRADQRVRGPEHIDGFGFEHTGVGNNAAGVIESITDGISAFRDKLISPSPHRRRSQDPKNTPSFHLQSGGIAFNPIYYGRGSEREPENYTALRESGIPG